MYTHSFLFLTHLSMSWVDRSSLWSHSVPLVPPLPCRLPHIFPLGCHSIWYPQLLYRCSWLPSRTDRLCGYGSEGPKTASAPSGCCWLHDRAWGLLDNRDLQELFYYFHSLKKTCIHFWMCLCRYGFLLTGWESAISAFWLVSCAADGFQVNAVVGATGDASHKAVGVQSVALCMPTWGC